MDKMKFDKVDIGRIFFMENTDTALAKIKPLPIRFKCSCGEASWNATNFYTNMHICPGTEVLVTSYHVRIGGV